MNYRNPSYTFYGAIDCEIEHPVFGWIPFTADPNDVAEHGREIFAKIVAEGIATPYSAVAENNKSVAETQ